MRSKLGWLIGALLALMLLGAVILRQPLGRLALGYTLKVLGRAVNGRVECERMGGDMFSNPQLSGVTVITGGDSLRAELLSIRYDFWALLRGRFALSEIRLVRPKLYITSKREVAAGRRRGRWRTPKLVIRSLTVTAGSLFLDEVERVDSLGLDLRLRSGGEEMELELSRGECRFTLEGIRIRHLAAAARLTPDSLVVQTLDVMSERSRLKGQLKVAMDSAGGVLRIENLTVDLGELAHRPGQLAMTGEAGQERGRQTARLVCQAEGLIWRRVVLPKLSGTLNLQDSLLTAEVRGGSEELGDFTLVANLGLRRFDLSGVAEVQNLAVSRFESGLPDFRLDAKVSVSGVLGSLKSGTDSLTDVREKSDTIDVRVAGRIAELGIDTVVANARYEGGMVELRELEMFGPAGGLRLRGALRRGTVRADCSLDSFDLNVLGRLLGGRLAGRAQGGVRLVSERDTWEVEGLIRLSGLSLAGVEVSDALAEINLLSQGPGTVPFVGREVSGRLALGGEGIKIGSLELTAAQFIWTGPEFDLRIDRSGDRLVALGDVEIREHSIAVRVDMMELVAPIDTVVNARPFWVLWRSDSLAVTGAEVNVADGTVGLNFMLRSGRRPWLALHARELNLRKLQKLLRLDTEVWGTMSLDIEGSDTLEVGLTGADIEISAAGLTWKRLDAALAITDSQVRVERFAFVHHVDSSSVTGQLSYSWERRLRITGAELTATFADPGVWILAATRQYVELKDGPLYGYITVRGDLKEPNISGRARISNGRLYVPSVNSTIERVNAELTFHGRRIVLEKLSGRSGKGTVLASGFWEFGDYYRAESLRYAIRFSGAAANPLPWVYGIGSGNISVSWEKGEQVVVAGVVDAEEALVTLGFGGSGPPASTEPSPVAYDLRVRAERGIWLRNRDADIELAGDLTLHSIDGEMEYSGELTARQGSFYYLDHSLRVTQAKLVLANVSQFNPDIDLRAELPVRHRQKGGDVPERVVIAVTGTLEKPIIVLSSEPAIWDESQVLSYLSFNVTLDELAAMEQKEVVSRLLSDRLLGYFQTQVSKKVREFVALDYLEFESGLANGAGAKVTVGKYIGRNLYVSYTQNFTGELQPAFRVEYYLNRRNELLAERSSDGRYSFRYRFKLRY
ncbi:MAG: translocation/assembly module TamB domain-containing protein [candidate division WOR-3 bacterium]